MSTQGQTPWCLSAGGGSSRNSIALKKCSTNGILRELFTLDNKGRLKSLRYKKFCVEPIDKTAFSQLHLRRCSKSKTSWLLDSRGHFLANGSKAAFSVSMIEGEGKIPFLSSMVEQNEDLIQEWKAIQRD